MTPTGRMTLDLRPHPVGRRLKLRRIERGLKQTDLAQMIGEHASRVCEAELGHGKLSPERMAAIQAAMDTELTRLELEALRP